MNITELKLRIKNWGEDALSEWGLIAIVFLVALISFGLGRLSAVEGAKPEVTIREAQTSSASASVPAGGAVVASKKGRTYNFPWCSGAGTIAEANKIWFKSEEEARRAGYAPAKNCKGLSR